MNSIQTLEGLTVVVPNWPAPSSVDALCTTRTGGVSKPPFDSFNLGLYVNDDPAAVMENRARLQALLPAEPVWLKQVHGSRVWDASKSNTGNAPIEADAAVTDQSNVVLAVMAADCLPVLLSSADGTVIGAAHAGWKGLLAGVLENTVDAMHAKVGSHSNASLMAWLGPAIGPTAFEVGEDVRCAYVNHAKQHDLELPHLAFVPIAARPGKYWANLYRLARQRLLFKGVSAIHGGEFCTVRDQKSFFSHRRDGISGRFAALIWRH